LLQPLGSFCPCRVEVLGPAFEVPDFALEPFDVLARRILTRIGFL
jgi:hypothetical protein